MTQKTHHFRVLFSAVLLLAVGAAGAQPVFFVSLEGNDAWTGTLPDPDSGSADGPFATLERARDALRAAGPAEGGFVYVRGGVYYLDGPLAFEAIDSGGPDTPVVWQAYQQEEVRLVGGIRIDGFETHRDAILKSDLSEANLPDEPFTQLFANRERQILARYPNVYEGGAPGGNWNFITEAVEDDRYRSFVYLGNQPDTWASTEGVQFSIWPNYNWWHTIAEIAEIDTASRTVHLKEALPYTIEPGRRFLFQNILEELDSPEEWYYDNKTKTLYFWPKEDIEALEVIVPRIESAIVIEGASHLNLIGLNVEAVRGDAVRIVDARECLFARSVVRNTGGFGVRVSGGELVRVVGNDIFDTGRGGIVLSGGDRKTLTPAGHQALNNHIHHFAQIVKTYVTAVNVEGVGNRIAHNLIHDAPHIGILLNGNDHIIEWNHIHHVCKESSDNGAFYMGRDWTQRGNIIRYNKFHDIYGFGLAGLGRDERGFYNYESPHQAWGVYLDDCSSGTTIFGNLFFRVPLCGVMIGGGRDNDVENNVFVECIPAWHIDARWDSYCWDLMQERLEAMDYTKPPYSERYPELLEMGDDPRRPANNRFVRNIVASTRDDFRGLSTTAPHPEGAVAYNLAPFDAGSTTIDENLIWHPEGTVRVAWSVYQEEGSATLEWPEWLEKGFDAKSIQAAPLFINPEKDDYELKKNSPALEEIGFRAVPFRKTGLYQDEFRASWPPPELKPAEKITHMRFPVIFPK